MNEVAASAEEIHRLIIKSKSLEEEFTNELSPS